MKAKTVEKIRSWCALSEEFSDAQIAAAFEGTYHEALADLHVAFGELVNAVAAEARRLVGR